MGLFSRWKGEEQKENSTKPSGKKIALTTDEVFQLLVLAARQDPAEFSHDPEFLAVIYKAMAGVTVTRLADGSEEYWVPGISIRTIRS